MPFPHKVESIVGYFDFWMLVATAAWAAFLAFTISTNSCKEKQTCEITLDFFKERQILSVKSETPLNRRNLTFLNMRIQTFINSQLKSDKIP
jgi:hypothetical protein